MVVNVVVSVLTVGAMGLAGLALGIALGGGRMAALAQLVPAGAASGAVCLPCSRLVRIPELLRPLGLLQSALHRG